MPILNYTTTIAASKTVAEIQAILAKAGAEQVIIRYGKNAEPTALVFELKGEMYMLPCRSEQVFAMLRRTNGIAAKLRTPEQALRVAWRILKDWTEAQTAIISTGMVDAQEVMLPYMLVRDNQTVYDQYREQRAERLLEQKS
jgi:hypothetical protein